MWLQSDDTEGKGRCLGLVLDVTAVEGTETKWQLSLRLTDSGKSRKKWAEDAIKMCKQKSSSETYLTWDASHHTLVALCSPPAWWL